MKYFVLTLSIVILFVASCTKVTTPVTSQDWLRNGKWRATSATYLNKTYSTTPVNDTFVYSSNPTNCTNDNYLVFGANYGGTVHTGNSKCYPTEPDTQDFYWELVNNNGNMNIYNADLFFGLPSVRATVSNFSSSSFTLQYYYYVPIPDPNNSARTINDTVDVTVKFSNY